ncbi:MAG TPA: gluconeogenesis factor YvcK family protein [Coriobacteriia bacterium]|nr:gluconeogenesis factor YvcK family protein [Coriobacteriia bacterium]
MSATRRRAVAIGGGTGLPIVLRCLVELGFETSAVVTMADDGGSSGLLRRELGMLPPGDVRNCLVALGDADGVMGRLFQYRFAHGQGLAGHALGNLIIAALAEIAGGFPEAIEEAGRLLGVRGHVFPSTLADVSLHATDALGQPVSGQARIAESAGPVTHVRLSPSDPEAYGPAVRAIRSADVVVLGPGSLFTSLVPNLLVPGVASALRESAARRVYICNVANQRGETSGMDAADHVSALLAHGLDGALDAVVVHESASAGGGVDRAEICEDESATAEAVIAGPEAFARIEALGPDVVAADLVDPSDMRHHSFDRLHAVLGRLVT